MTPFYATDKNEQTYLIIIQLWENYTWENKFLWYIFSKYCQEHCCEEKIGHEDLVFEWKIKTWSRNDREKRKNTAILGLTFGMLINQDYIYYEKNIWRCLIT